ncbi:hypothetical protein B0H10DRAFT_2191725 [Mycena sp. CBHHK59/15]|nr:hypothetical protein B0H10DRAFT_2191725 [Mycena sp. CBHHK59/15]
MRLQSLPGWLQHYVVALFFPDEVDGKSEIPAISHLNKAGKVAILIAALGRWNTRVEAGTINLQEIQNIICQSPLVESGEGPIAWDTRHLYLESLTTTVGTQECKPVPMQVSDALSRRLLGGARAARRVCRQSQGWDHPNARVSSARGGRRSRGDDYVQTVQDEPELLRSASQSRHLRKSAALRKILQACKTAPPQATCRVCAQPCTQNHPNVRVCGAEGGVRDESTRWRLREVSTPWQRSVRAATWERCTKSGSLSVQGNACVGEPQCARRARVTGTRVGGRFGCVDT